MMDVQTAPPTYTPVGGMRPTMGNPPVLGQQVPGMSGGLPAQGGLSVTANPMAKELQSYGRGDDSMLVHMTPNEVNSLQGLAVASGGSLTINPETGLPEAGWLGKLLPTILGAALAATGVGAPLAAGIVGAGQFARTGSLKKGLMAGLGAFGGAGMAGMAGLGGSISHNAAGLLSDKAGMFGANMGLGAAANPVATYLNSPELAQQFAEKFGTQTAGAASPAGSFGASMENAINAPNLVAQRGADITASAIAKAPTIAAPVGPTALQGGGAQFTGGLGSRFGQAVRTGLPEGTPSFLAKRAPMIAGLGALSNISDASQPKLNKYDPNKDKEDDWNYEGPYRTMPRRFDPTVEGEGEIQFFDEVNPIGYLTASGERRGYAEGGSTSGEKLSDSYKALEDRINAAYEASGGGNPQINQAVKFRDYLSKAPDEVKNAIANRSNADKDTLNSLFDNKTTGWVGLNDIGEDFKPTANAADKFAYLAMTSGFIDPITGQKSGLAAPTDNLKPGGLLTMGDKMLRLNENRQWETVGETIYNPATWIFDKGRIDWAKSKPTQPTGGLGTTAPATGGGGGGGVKPPEDKISVDTLGTTIDPTKGGVTPGTGTGATLTDRPDIPGATYDSPGVQTLKDLYTPKFTQKDDFVTAKRDPYTMGSELSAKLPEATARYQTSPGAVTASRTYAGGSPSERIRAAAQANAAARAAAAAAAAAGTTTPSTTTPASTTPGTGGELDFGIPKTTSTAGPANTAGPASDRGYTGLSGNNPYMNIYNQQTNQQPNLNAGNVMDTGNVGGEMDFGFGFGPPAQGQTNPNVNLASLIGTDAFFEELSKRYGGGGGGNAEYGMPNNQVLAAGGPVNMHNGAFVVDARTVSELGNGSSNAGIELLQRLGGQPVRGRGDGVSDSVPARIGGKQEARVARDEVIFQPKAVKRLGGGSAKRGTQKLYAMMEKAHKARKRAGRGQDTKLAKGLV